MPLGVAWSRLSILSTERRQGAAMVFSRAKLFACALTAVAAVGATQASAATISFNTTGNIGGTGSTYTFNSGGATYQLEYTSVSPTLNLANESQYYYNASRFGSLS